MNQFVNNIKLKFCIRNREVWNLTSKMINCGYLK